MGGPRLHGFLHGTNSRSPANYEDLCETGPASHLAKPEDLEHPSPNQSMFKKIAAPTTSQTNQLNYMSDCQDVGS